MNERSVAHDTFVIERTYQASPAQVFAAFADPKRKAKWFVASDEFDFRIGGQEVVRGGPPGGPVYTNVTTYHEIVEEQRIVYTYTLDMNETRISVSVTTIEMETVDEGTRLTFTEQGVFFDGHDTPAQRQHGTKAMLEQLAEVL